MAAHPAVQAVSARPSSRHLLSIRTQRQPAFLQRISERQLNHPSQPPPSQQHRAQRPSFHMGPHLTDLPPMDHLVDPQPLPLPLSAPSRLVSWRLPLHPALALSPTRISSVTQSNPAPSLPPAQYSPAALLKVPHQVLPPGLPFVHHPSPSHPQVRLP